MPVSPSRAAAFDILLRVERDRAFASDLLHSDRLNNLSQQDRGLATELVLGTLRWQSTLDAAIAAQSSQPLHKLDVEVLIAVRLAAYQLRFLDRVPANAAVNESVELVKRARKRSAVPFANAVLRKLAKDAASISDDPKSAHPSWLVDRWNAYYGAEATAAICRYNQQVPETALRLPFDPARREQVERELSQGGIQLAPGQLLHSARRLISGDLTHTEAFRRGDVWIQDEASQLVALLAGGGQHILDCCAAPGGKTSFLAERNPQSQILALDLHDQRAQLLRQRVRNANVEIRTADVITADTGNFDCILADVPCSGTGTLSRNPEIKWHLRPEDLADLASRQSKILHSALEKLVPGGRLLYSTCSLEPEEGEKLVENVLQKPFELANITSELPKIASELAIFDVNSWLRGPYLRTIPGLYPCDGFFAALITRPQ
ncbi:MAG TPA: 16S rRNA (cytosine(967)-C(5))-methyltransferase RsmB [Candidatus Koribacter sp.]